MSVIDVKINIVNDFSTGFNTHNLLLPPAIPAPVPTFSVEMFATQRWPPGYALNQNKLTTTVTHKGMRVVQDGHDCGVMIFDVTIPPSNVYYVIMWPFSSRKIAFAASTVTMNGTAAGCADMSGPAPFPMMTCGNPMTLPTAMVVNNAWNTVTVGMTLADILAGIAGIAASIVIDLVTGSTGSGNDFVDGLFPMANPRKLLLGAASGLVISGVRSIATGGEYPVSVSLAPTSPWAGGGVQVTWTPRSREVQVQGSSNILNRQQTSTTTWTSRGRSPTQDALYDGGRPLQPPTNEPGWTWSDDGGWSR